MQLTNLYYYAERVYGSAEIPTAVFAPQAKLGSRTYRGDLRSDVGKVEVVAKLYDSALKDDLLARRNLIFQCSEQNLGCYIGVYRIRDNEKSWVALLHEYVSGVDLRRFVTTERDCNLETLLRCFLKIAKGVQWLHRRNVYHSNIHPTAIILAKEKSGDLYPVLINYIDVKAESSSAYYPFGPPEGWDSQKGDVFCLGSVILYWLSQGKYDTTYVTARTIEGWRKDLETHKVMKTIPEGKWGNDGRYVGCKVLISSMLDLDPETRPDIDFVVERLELLLNDVIPPADVDHLQAHFGSPEEDEDPAVPLEDDVIAPAGLVAPLNGHVFAPAVVDSPVEDKELAAMEIMQVGHPNLMEFIANFTHNQIPRTVIFVPLEKLGFEPKYRGYLKFGEDEEEVVVKFHKTIDAYEQEFWAARNIQCSVQNFPCYVGAIRSGSMKGIVYKYIEGVTLRRFVYGGNDCNFETVLRCFFNLAKCVQWLHRKDVCHSKISPTTILLQEEESGDLNPVLTDLAHLRAETPMSLSPFRPPEYLNSKKADIFSLGATILFWLSNGVFNEHYCYEISEWYEELKTHKVMDTMPKGVWGDDDRYAECKVLISQMLDYHPSKRPDIDSVVERLELLLNDVIAPVDEQYSGSVSGSSSARSGSVLQYDEPQHSSQIQTIMRTRGAVEIKIGYQSHLPALPATIKFIEQLQSTELYDAAYIALLTISGYDERPVIVHHTRVKKQFYHDMKVGRKLQDNSNIGRYVGVFVDVDNGGYNVMYDYQPAWNVEEFINIIRTGQAHRPTLTTVFGVFYQLAVAVRDMHRSGLIHTALSPEHVFIRKTQNFNELSPVIFGLGRVCMGEKAWQKRVSMGIETWQEYYVYPECRQDYFIPNLPAGDEAIADPGDYLTPRLDTYDLGVLFYYWLSDGKYPYPMEKDKFNTALYLNVEAYRISEFDPLPEYAQDSRYPRLFECIRQMIDHDKRRRPSMDRIVAFLHAAWQENGKVEPYEYISDKEPPLDIFLSAKEREDKDEAVIHTD